MHLHNEDHRSSVDRYLDATDEYHALIRALRRSKRRWWQRSCPPVTLAEVLFEIGPATRVTDYLEDN